MRRPPTQGRPKQSYSHEASPVSSKPRKDNLASHMFQAPELNNKLRLGTKLATPYQIQNSSKNRDDVKLLTTNVFINNLNIQIKPKSGLNTPSIYPSSSKNDQASRISKRSPFRANHDGLSDMDSGPFKHLER